MLINEKKVFNVFATKEEKTSFYNLLKQIKEDAISSKMEYSPFYMEYTFVTPYGIFHYAEDDDKGIPSFIQRVA